MFYNKKNRGQGIAEYALVVASVGVLLIGSLSFLGNNVNSNFGSINNTLSKNIVQEKGTQSSQTSAVNK